MGETFGKFWRKAELRAQHFPLSVFLLEEFSPPTADDFTILGGEGVEILAFALPTLQVQDKALHSSKSQSFRVS